MATKILLIEDEAVLVRSIVRMIGTRAQVQAVDCGARALEALRAGADWDVMICDLHLPDVHVAALYDTIVSARPHLGSRTIVMTGGITTMAQRLFLERSPVALLLKPFALEPLLQAIDLALTR